MKFEILIAYVGIAWLILAELHFKGKDRVQAIGSMVMFIVCTACLMCWVFLDGDFK